MAFTFVFTQLAKKQTDKLDTLTRRRIAKKLQQLAQYDDLSHIATNLEGQFAGKQRIRVGTYRIICEIEVDIVTVLRVEHRRKIYQ